MEKEKLVELFNDYDWYETTSRNKFMWSFSHADEPFRLNFYYTTGTLTIQDKNQGPCRVWKNLEDLKTVETILINA